MRANLLYAVALLVLSLALPQAPASADTQGSLVLPPGAGAVMAVGEGFSTPCTKTSAGAVVGKGLHDAWNNGKKNRVFSISVAGLTGLLNGELVTAELHVCGRLTQVGGNSGAPGLGASCQTQKAYAGIGQLKAVSTLDGTVWWWNIFDFGWKTSAGPHIVPHGKFQEAGTQANGSKGAKQAKFATLGGKLTLTTQPQRCAQPKEQQGETAPVLRGTLIMTNRGGSKDSVVRPNHLPATCKSTGDIECLYPTKKEPAPAKGT